MSYEIQVIYAPWDDVSLPAVLGAPDPEHCSRAVGKLVLGSLQKDACLIVFPLLSFLFSPPPPLLLDCGFYLQVTHANGGLGESGAVLRS